MNDSLVHPRPCQNELLPSPPLKHTTKQRQCMNLTMHFQQQHLQEQISHMTTVRITAYDNFMNLPP